MPKSKLSEFEQAIFDNWLKTYKNSALSRLVLQAVAKDAKYPKQIEVYINEKVDGLWSVDEKSLHRTMRRLSNLDLVDYDERQAPKTGAKRKYYSITESGARILTQMQSANSC